MTHTWLRGLLSVAMAVVLISCSQDESAQQKRANIESESVTLGIAMQPSSALFIVADEKGFFQQHGLDAEIREFPSGKRALNEGLYQGVVDFVSSSDMPVAMGGLQGRDIQVIATIFGANNVNRIVARCDSGINKPADLRGKRVATQKSSAVHYFLHLFLLNQGMVEADVEMSYMKAEQLVEDLVAGKIDAFSMREPYVSMAKQRLGDKCLIFEAPGVYNQVDLVLTTGAMVSQKRATIERLLKALLEAEKFVKSDTRQSIEIVARRLGVASEEVENIWPTVTLEVSMDQSLLLLLENQARWAISEGLVAESEVPNYLNNFYIDGLKAIKPEAVTVIE